MQSQPAAVEQDGGGNDPKWATARNPAERVPGSSERPPEPAAMPECIIEFGIRPRASD